MQEEFFKLNYPATGNIHQMRRTPAGISHIRETGQFRQYMQAYVDSKYKPFVAWDGEAWTGDDMGHHYMLLQTSTGTRIHAEQLTSAECLAMILEVASEHPKAIHVIYGGGYDATHILRDLPLELSAQLKDNNQITYNVPATETTKRNRYKINYLPHKWLEISGYDWTHERWSHIKIFDVMTFFQTSFIKALQSRHIEVPEIITSGKASRSDFTYADLEEISRYCQMELELLVQLCNKLRDEMVEAGIWLTQFHGPGAVANVIYRTHKIKNYMGVTSPEIEYAAQHAYYGGRFEQFKAGHYTGKVYLYDINSAYPYHISNLPNLAGARWERTTDFHGQLGVWLCTYDDIDNNYRKPHPLPWRGRTGQVGFPAHNTAVWVWTPEAIHAQDIQYGYELHIANDLKPFSFVPELFTKRREWQKLGKGGERALKLAMNSLYGKMAQRVGGKMQEDGKPKYHKLEWAGLVTSSTRAQLWDAIKQNPDCVISVETDSICTTEPLDLDIGNGLGQWGLTEYDWITYIQSGIYFTSDGIGKSKSKTRGIDTKELHYSEVLEFLDGDQTEPLLVSSRNFIGLGNPRTYLYGQWQDSVKEVHVAGQKRVHDKRSCAACASRLSMSTHLHDLIAAPHYGITPSAPHPLPWIQGGVTPELAYVGDAVEEYDVTRRVR